MRQFEAEAGPGVRAPRRAGTFPVVLALSLALAGCGMADHPLPPAARPQPPSPPIASSGLPFPADRDSSSLTETTILGKDATARSGGAVELGSALLLGTAPTARADYALYRFNSGGHPPDSVSIGLEPGSTAAAYVGMADYARGRWEFHGPYTATKTLAIDGGAYVSPVGNIWVAVLTYQTEAQVDFVSVRSLSPGNSLPTAA